jgi:1,4-alpha-glucan branching enzyme
MDRLPPLGGLLEEDGVAVFRVWAPGARSVAVRVGGREHELAPAGGGVLEARVVAGAGSDYVFVLDGGRERPDPCSRFQPEGIRGPSRLVDVRAFEWTDAARPGLSLPIEIEVDADEDAGVLRMRRGRAELVLDFRLREVELRL